jgi:hypothetical protein
MIATNDLTDEELSNSQSSDGEEENEDSEDDDITKNFGLSSARQTKLSLMDPHQIQQSKDVQDILKLFGHS